MLRHLANFEKALWFEAMEWDRPLNDKLPLEMERLAKWMLKFSERWKRPDGADKGVLVVGVELVNPG